MADRHPSSDPDPTLSLPTAVLGLLLLLTVVLAVAFVVAAQLVQTP